MYAKEKKQCRHVFGNAKKIEFENEPKQMKVEESTWMHP
jgi:hypothetical protein